MSASPSKSIPCANAKDFQERAALRISDDVYPNRQRAGNSAFCDFLNFSHLVGWTVLAYNQIEEVNDESGSRIDKAD